MSTNTLSFWNIKTLMQHTDLMMAVALIALMLVLILPLPVWILDLGLTLSFSLAVLILMTTMFIKKPLELSSFPTLLLFATFIRLSLNVASTRVILNEGHQGPHAAGHVIEAFGSFLMQGNALIGIVVFAILLIVNFIVVTKGSGRIAEVSARFSLDAMPGKQMAIDADLSAGMIDEDTAKKRRKELEDESTFYGSMDGAAKFVRGDAIAGLIITFINIIFGIIIGTMEHGLTMAEAGKTYVFLTVGDGLVTQIPALLIAIAAGILVTKAGVEGSVDKAVLQQLGNYPKSIGLSAVMILCFAAMPGVPKLPFLTIALMLGGVSFYIYKTRRNALTKGDKGKKTPRALGSDGRPVALPAGSDSDEEEAPPLTEDQIISNALHIDAVRLELGYGLIPLVKGSFAGQSVVKLPEQIRTLRKTLVSEMGFIAPSIRIQDNLQLASEAYVIYVKDIEVGRGTLRPNCVMALSPSGESITLTGETTTDPAFGLPAMWITQSERDAATLKGYTVVEPSAVLMTHLTEVVKDHMPDLLSYGETQKLLDQIREDHKKLIEDIIPEKLSVTILQRILQALLKERVSIRDLPAILEALAEVAGQTRNIVLLVEHVRQALSRTLCQSHIQEDGTLSIVAVGPQWEQTFEESLVGQGDMRTLGMAPSQMQKFVKVVNETFEDQMRKGNYAVLMTSAGIRPYVRMVLERLSPSTPVLSQFEIHPKVKIRTVAQI